ncbi:MAG: hypothetical protein AB7F36_14380 [Reyranellaceae bacterium]
MMEDKALVRFNATRHGVLSRYTILPWEDPEEYGAILAGLREEHAPHGPTEEHLVEELAGIIWRKRRLRLAEAAVHREGLAETMDKYSSTARLALVHLVGGGDADDVKDAIRGTPDLTEEAVREVAADEKMTRRALDLLGSRRNDRYEAALAALREDTRDWWTNILTYEEGDLDDGEAVYEPDPDHLRRFIETKVVPWYGQRRTELANRPLIRDQAFGEALDANKLEVLARYEVHLDRKMERMLTMLVRLKELRQAAAPG